MIGPPFSYRRGFNLGNKTLIHLSTCFIYPEKENTQNSVNKRFSTFCWINSRVATKHIICSNNLYKGLNEIKGTIHFNFSTKATHLATIKSIIKIK